MPKLLSDFQNSAIKKLRAPNNGKPCYSEMYAKSMDGGEKALAICRNINKVTWIDLSNIGRETVFEVSDRHVKYNIKYSNESKFGLFTELSTKLEQVTFSNDAHTRQVKQLNNVLDNFIQSTLFETSVVLSTTSGFLSPHLIKWIDFENKDLLFKYCDEYGLREDNGWFYNNFYNHFILAHALYVRNCEGRDRSQHITLIETLGNDVKALFTLTLMPRQGPDLPPHVIVKQALWVVYENDFIMPLRVKVEGGDINLENALDIITDNEIEFNTNSAIKKLHTLNGRICDSEMYGQSINGKDWASVICRSGDKVTSIDLRNVGKLFVFEVSDRRVKYNINYLNESKFGLFTELSTKLEQVTFSNDAHTRQVKQLNNILDNLIQSAVFIEPVVLSTEATTISEKMLEITKLTDFKNADSLLEDCDEYRIIEDNDYNKIPVNELYVRNCEGRDRSQHITLIEVLGDDVKAFFTLTLIPKQGLDFPPYIIVRQVLAENSNISTHDVVMPWQIHVERAAINPKNVFDILNARVYAYFNSSNSTAENFYIYIASTASENEESYKHFADEIYIASTASENEESYKHFADEIYIASTASENEESYKHFADEL